MYGKNLQATLVGSIGLAMVLAGVNYSEAKTVALALAWETTELTSDTQVSNLAQQEFFSEALLIALEQQTRVALVIGNGDYTDAPLDNPTNDAAAIKDALERLGFQVIFETNLDWHSMDRAIEEFSEQLEPGGVGLFYYAGHGVQVEGENYLIPVDARLSRQRHVNREAVSLNTVLNFMESAENAVNVVIIDSCRDNPFYRQWRSNSGSGLAEVTSPPEGTIISFATEPGNVAEDGNGNHSPYTAALLEHLDEPIDIGLMFRKVRRSVFQNTEGLQRPRTDDALIGEFSLNSSTESLISSSPSSPIPAENGTPPSSLPVPDPTPTSSQTPTLTSTFPVIESGANLEQPLETALDLTQFRSFAQAGNWQQADREMYKLLLQSGDKDGGEWLSTSEIQSLSCTDLMAIDQAWKIASGGRFGFSVQSQIWMEVGSPTTHNDAVQWDEFYSRVGWVISDLVWHVRDDITPDITAPIGHFPYILRIQNPPFSLTPLFRCTT